MQAFDVSPRKRNKRFQINQSNREECTIEYLKSNWIVRIFYVDNFGIDPPTVHGDHRNEAHLKELLINWI